MDQERILLAIGERVLACSPADETEVMVQQTAERLTRFANNAIHQNVEERSTLVRVRAAIRGRMGVATTHDTSDAGLAAAAGRACALAAHAGPYSGFVEPDGEPLPPAIGYVVRTAECGPEARAATVTVACREAERVGLEAFGAFSITEQAIAIVNTRRLRRYHQGTAARFRTVVKGRDGSGWAAAASSDVGEIDAGALGARAAGIARLSQSPGRVPPGEYAVVLSADAVAELLACLAYVSFGGLAVREERSFVSRTRGQRIMSPLVSVWDDGLDPHGLPVPFDCEGVRRQKVSLVEAGVPVGAVWDRRSALEAGPGHVSTGHALLPNDNFTGPLAANLFMAPGEAMPADLLRSVGRGIWVNRFWYTTVVHPMSVLVSGMTRDGTFLIEDGELGRPVQPLRFISSFVDALGDVVAVSRETSLVETLWGMVRAPALAIARFHFTG